MQKKFLISGIGFSSGGVGRLMEKLAPEAKLRGYTVLSRRMVNISELIRKKDFLLLFLELILRIQSLIVFKLRTTFLKGNMVLALHPQSIGYKTFVRLIKNNSVCFYVMDNSFFCMMSYNYNKETRSECLRCVSDPLNSMSSCYSWPAPARKKTAVNYLDALTKYSHKIVFLAQTKSQKELLKDHFGAEINCHIVGMEPADPSPNVIMSLDVNNADDKEYDLVYHGSLHPAKGFLYFLHLSSLLPDLKIFIPASVSSAASVFKDVNMLAHVTFEDCTWETGLMVAVKNAKLVVNPSLWSSPVEGAFLKSIAYNGNVAVVESKFGFPQEAVNQNIVLGLPVDPADAAKVIEDYLDNSVNNSDSAKEWLLDFYKTNKTQNVFDAIELSK